MRAGALWINSTCTLLRAFGPHALLVIYIYIHLLLFINLCLASHGHCSSSISCTACWHCLDGWTVRPGPRVVFLPSRCVSYKTATIPPSPSPSLHTHWPLLQSTWLSSAADYVYLVCVCVCVCTGWTVVYMCTGRSDGGCYVQNVHVCIYICWTFLSNRSVHTVQFAYSSYMSFA